MQTPTFLGSEFEGKSQKTTDRETFRIIKQAFLSVNNQIEANRIYSYEMESYRHELRTNGSKPERLLLWFNAIISNHGQDYLKAACWFLLCILIIAIVMANHENQWIGTKYTGPIWWQYIRNTLNGFARGFLPLSGVYKENYEFFQMIMTFILSGVTWHLLIALRRHKKS